MDTTGNCKSIVPPFFVLGMHITLSTALAVVTFLSVFNDMASATPCPSPCTCDHNGTEASCTHSRLALFPSSFPESVQSINLSFNEIEKIPQLQTVKLTALALSHNRIKVILRNTFTRLTTLQNLDLSYNRLDTLDGDDLDGLESLLTLNLEGNLLRKLGRYVFHRCPNLKTLKLSGNPLRHIDGSWFRNLDVLESLEARRIDAFNLADDVFSLATRLNHIDISENDFPDIPAGLGSARNLRILRMDRNPLLKLNSDSLKVVRRLRELYLSNMPRLESIEEGSFWYMKSLRVLEISGNPHLKQVNGGSFQWGVSPIVKLVLANNSLHTLDERFAELCEQGRLQLDGNLLLCDCQASWMKRCSYAESLK